MEDSHIVDAIGFIVLNADNSQLCGHASDCGKGRVIGKDG